MNRRIYCDSSVLLKRYREEPDSETCSRELERMTLGGDFLLSSKLALVEVTRGIDRNLPPEAAQEDLDEAVEIANRTRYGLANGVWSSDGARAMWVASRLRSGVVWLNTYNMFDSSSPFGGVRESGYGREGGVTGMRAYVKGGAR